MENLNNLKVQRLTIFGLLVLFIISQTFLPIKGAGFYLILPSLFMLLTYKPKNLGYGRCFILGIINDLFCLQILGMSSIIFLTIRFIKLFYVDKAPQNYWTLFKEYVIYALGLLVVVYSFIIILGIDSFNLVEFLSVVILQLSGFFISYYLWSRIFEFLDE